MHFDNVQLLFEPIRRKLALASKKILPFLAVSMATKYKNSGFCKFMNYSPKDLFDVANAFGNAQLFFAPIQKI